MRRFWTASYRYQSPANGLSGDFMLILATRHFLMSSSAQADIQALRDPVESGPGVFHIGETGPFDTCLLEVLLIEAYPATATTAPLPGLLRGLADARFSQALRCMHQQPEHPWAVAALACEAALSRSTFLSGSIEKSTWHPWSVCSIGVWR